MPFAETPREAQSGSQGVGEDPFDVHVAARAGISGGRKAPSAVEGLRSGGFGAEKVVAVGEAHRDEAGLQRLPFRKAERPCAAGAVPHLGQRGKSCAARLLRPQQAQQRKVTIRQFHTRKRGA